MFEIFQLHSLGLLERTLTELRCSKCRRQTSFSTRPASAGLFLDDPDCLHMSNLKDPNSVFRDAIHDQLDALTRSGFVKNHDYKKIFKSGWYERERRKHTVAHASAKYFFPRRACNDYEQVFEVLQSKHSCVFLPHSRRHTGPRTPGQASTVWAHIKGLQDQR